jgi:hypothetical protein
MDGTSFLSSLLMSSKKPHHTFEVVDVLRLSLQQRLTLTRGVPELTQACSFGVVDAGMQIHPASLHERDPYEQSV